MMNDNAYGQGRESSAVLLVLWSKMQDSVWLSLDRLFYLAML